VNNFSGSSRINRTSRAARPLFRARVDGRLALTSAKKSPRASEGLPASPLPTSLPQASPPPALPRPPSSRGGGRMRFIWRRPTTSERGEVLVSLLKGFSAYVGQANFMISVPAFILRGFWRKEKLSPVLPGAKGESEGFPEAAREGRASEREREMPLARRGREPKGGSLPSYEEGCEAAGESSPSRQGPLRPPRWSRVGERESNTCPRQGGRRRGRGRRNGSARRGPPPTDGLASKRRVVS